MKKPNLTALRAATAAALACGVYGAQAQSQLQITGILSAGPAYLSNAGGGGQLRLQNNLNWSNSLTIRGTEDLGGGLFASFALAANVNVKNGTIGQGGVAFSKNSWVGLGTRTLGTVQIGRNDVFSPEQCVTSAMCIGGLVFNLHPGNLDRVGGSQLANMFKYVSPEFGNFRVRAYWAHGEPDSTTNRGRAVGAVIHYRHEGVMATASYESIRGAAVMPMGAGNGFGLQRLYGTAATGATSITLDEQQIALLGVRVPVENFTLYAQASNVRLMLGPNRDAMKTIELGATYNFSSALSLTAAAYRSTFSSSTWNNQALMLNYALSKRTSVFGGIANETVSGPNTVAQLFQAPSSSNDRQAAVAVGMRHTF